VRIGINARFLLDGKMEGFGWYSYEITKRLVQNHPEHEFIFFFDRSYSEKFIFGSNVTPVVIQPPARHPILFMLWFDIALPRALKKYKIDVFFSPDGYLSLRTKVPQIATIHDLNFEHFPEDLPFAARKYLRYFFPKFAHKAQHIITVSNYSKDDLVKTYAVKAEKITVAWNAASNIFKPIELEQKQLIRNTYSNGKQYFVFVGSLHPRKNIPRLLKAFEIYCEDQSNDWDMVIVGEALWNKSDDYTKFTGSFKNRIHFTGRLALDDLALVVGSASCMTYVPYFEGFGIPLVEAMNCGVPIISGDLTSLPEVAGDSAIYCNPFDVNDIAKKMVEVSTNSLLRDSLSTKSLDRSSLFNWDKSAQIVWDSLIKISNL
jgi:glycosyltransferase involved in cell wall biosynthesis